MPPDVDSEGEEGNFGDTRQDNYGNASVLGMMILPVARRRPGPGASLSHDSDSMIMCACDTDHDHRDSESELVPVTVSVRHSDRQGHCHCDSDRRPARAAALLGVGSRAPGWRLAGLRRLSHGH